MQFQSTALPKLFKLIVELLTLQPYQVLILLYCLAAYVNVFQYTNVYTSDQKLLNYEIVLKSVMFILSAFYVKGNLRETP